MAELVESIDISRRPGDVFAYAADFSNFPDWQGGVVSARREGDGPLAVGSRAIVTRKLGPRKLARTEEITELNPPRTCAVHGGGPLTAIAKLTIEPLDAGQRSRVTIALDFKAHGIGRLLLPLVIRRQARKQLPKNEQRLKEVLERGA
jgi:carbon monoxide dehydrogenase subunit G